MKLHVRVSPNAKQSAILGWESHPIHGKVLRLRIAAAPIDGLANKAVIALLAKALDCPKSRLTLDKGCSGREKTILIPADVNIPDVWSSP